MIKVALAKKIRWAFKKKEELGVKILVLIGGRGSTKSTAAADVVLAKTQAGERWCCGREFLNSIEDSCQAMLEEEIERIGFQGFDVQSSKIRHASGGEIFHKGLARNPASIKSIVADGIWIEEGETLSEKTLKVLSASFRISAGKKAKAKKEGKQAKVPDIIITMNRGSSKDPISLEYLSRAETTISKQGWYADENLLIVEVNYTDMPEEWFKSSGLEEERISDLRNKSKAEYEHKWLGKYFDTIDNAIIMPEWFDACIDAHIKLEKLGRWDVGQERVSFDPADAGDDPEALAYQKGNVVYEAMSADAKDIEEACNWACSYANDKRVDSFTWDCDGMGIGLKSQISHAFKGKKVETDQFKGSEGAFMPDEIYERVDEDTRSKTKTNKDTFANQRAQFYWNLRDKMFKTWLAVEKGRYYPVDEMISFSKDIKHLALLRAELCSIPRKYISSGRIQLLTKAEMLKKDISSPNIGDCVMMLQKPIMVDKPLTKLPPMRSWG